MFCLLKKRSILTLLMLLTGPLLFAQESNELSLSVSLDTLWLVLCAALVFFMQAGFAMVETGLTRAKNAGNIIMKNLMDFAGGSLIFWALGWGLMYGEDLGGFIGISAFFPNQESLLMRDWFFQAVFAATAATIVSGAMAERTKFVSYLAYSVVLTGLIYPISGHWIWNSQGWLAKMGFHDFAGSTVVHGLGGAAALAGALILGPRAGKYIMAQGKKRSMPIMGHNLPLAALGVFILWFGWYGFNAGSTLSGTNPNISIIAVTTTLAAAAGAIASMITVWILNGKPDVSMSLNGALAGLVAITAPCAVVSNQAAVVIGVIAGILVVFSVEFLDKILHIDDPVGAVSVHGVCGIWGTVAVGIFGDLEKIGSGLSRWQQIGVQSLGTVSVIFWSFVGASVLFLLLSKTLGLRVREEEELAGLDLDEHGIEAYAGFQIFQTF